MVGTGNTYYGELDNLTSSLVGVAVDPSQRGRGHGHGLLSHACAIAAAAARTTLILETKIPFDDLATHPHRRFAAAAGFTLSNVEVVRDLALPVDDATIAGWSHRAAERAAGYRVETFVNDVPAELLPSLCALHGQLGVDAPTGEVEWEEEVSTPEMFVRSRADMVAAGRTVLETVAIAPGGTVAAYSTIMVPPSPCRDASQWGTFVHREHRGHRLGLAVKAANLRALQQSYPRRQRIRTQNAETNQWMIAINELMGFEPVEASVELVRRR